MAAPRASRDGVCKLPVACACRMLTSGEAPRAAAGQLSFPYPQQASSTTPTICNFSGKTYW